MIIGTIPGQICLMNRKERKAHQLQQNSDKQEVRVLDWPRKVGEQAAVEADEHDASESGEDSWLVRVKEYTEGEELRLLPEDVELVGL